LVSLSNPKGFRFSNKLFKVAGVFHVMPPARAIDAKGAVLYRLDDATLR
jgi:acetyl-CoA carboxylase alpha subunit